VRRRLLAALAAVALVAAVYMLVLRDEAVAPRLVDSRPASVIGSGSSAVAVAPDGTILPWLSLPEDSSLPQLPLSTPPEDLRLRGPVLAQARVLGAAPAALRPYLLSSYYGTSGVNVELTSGIELRFGDASQAKRKWRAAAAMLASPSVTALDYVNVHAPSRPTIGGSGHTLPPPP
jgi:hypothetical protein